MVIKISPKSFPSGDGYVKYKEAEVDRSVPVAILKNK